MRKIYKYQLETTDTQTVRIPKLIGAKNFKEQVLKIDTQGEVPCLWCLVDVEEPEQEVGIRIVGTGNTMPLLSKDDYLGTYMLYGEGLVFHVFLEWLN